MIYFLQVCNEDGFIKIGHTTRCVKRRITQIRRDIPFYKLAFLGCMEGDRGREQRILKRFSYCRVKNEWFRPAPRLLRFIKAHANRKMPKSDGLTQGGKLFVCVTISHSLWLDLKKFSRRTGKHMSYIIGVALKRFLDQNSVACDPRPRGTRKIDQSKVFAFRVPNETMERLRKRAKATSQPMVTYIRKALKEYLSGKV